MESLETLEECHKQLVTKTNVALEFPARLLDSWRNETMRLVSRKRVWRAFGAVADELLVWRDIPGSEVAGTVQWAFGPDGQFNLQLPQNDSERGTHITDVYLSKVDVEGNKNPH